MVKFSLTGKLAKIMTPPVMSHLAIFLEFLTSDTTLHSFKSIIWNNLNTRLIGSGLDEEIIIDNIQFQLQVHLIVLNNLRIPEVKKKKNLRVTFEETEEILRPSKLFFNENYKTDLANFVNSILQFYLNKTSYSEVGHLYANHVCQVISAFKNYGVDKKLSQTLPVTNDKTSLFRLYESYVRIWINDDKILTYNLISVIIGLLESIENMYERIIIIEDFNLVSMMFNNEVIFKYYS